MKKYLKKNDPSINQGRSDKQMETNYKIVGWTMMAGVIFFIAMLVKWLIKTYGI